MIKKKQTKWIWGLGIILFLLLISNNNISRHAEGGNETTTEDVDACSIFKFLEPTFNENYCGVGAVGVFIIAILLIILILR